MGRSLDLGFRLDVEEQGLRATKGRAFFASESPFGNSSTSRSHCTARKAAKLRFAEISFAGLHLTRVFLVKE
jgi:hypothetical protein